MTKHRSIAAALLLTIFTDHSSMQTAQILPNTPKYSQCLFESAEHNIRELYSRETWEISAERGHTALPLLFQNTVLSLLATVK